MEHPKHRDGKIPKILHYCWFGGGKKPRLVEMCRKSWGVHLADYEWMEWNEDNFDVSAHPYVREAYEARKFAFVSDYVRLHALYAYGGVYLDTDVEVVRSFEPLRKHEAFSGFEDGVHLQSGTMGAMPGHPWIKAMLDDYDGRRFVLPDGSLDLTTNTSVMSRLSEPFGLRRDGTYQHLDVGVVFYPRTYFSPYDYINGERFLTDESYSIHHYSQSWLPAHVRMRGEFKRTFGRFVGPKVVSYVRRLLTAQR